jgi:parvulin-like peptidyl-prolyl isomerase
MNRIAIVALVFVVALAAANAGGPAGVAGAVGGVTAASQGSGSGSAAAPAAKSDRPPTGATAKLDRVIVTVDALPIWQSELDEIFSRNELAKPTPEQTQQALDALIDAELVDLAATNLHVTVEARELDMAEDEIKKQNSIDDAGLDKALAEQHFTRAQYRFELGRQLRAQKVYQVILVPHLDITDEDLKQAYEQMKATTPGIDTFDKIKDQLRQMVWSRKLATMAEAWLKSRRGTAHIVRRP